MPALPLPHDVPVDPDRDQARRWAQEELGSGEYALQDSMLVRAWRWVAERLPDPDLPGSLPPWANVLILAAVLVVVAAVVAFALRDRWRPRGLSAGASAGGVLDEEGMDAAAYRRRARAALAGGDADAATLDGFRALVAAGAERSLLDDAPARTAHEAATLLDQVLPGHGDGLRWAAGRFDEIRYGDGHASTADAEATLALDQELLRSTPRWESATRRGLVVPR